MKIFRLLVLICLFTSFVSCDRTPAQTSTQPVTSQAALSTQVSISTATSQPTGTATPLAKPTQTFMPPSPTVDSASLPPALVPTPLSKAGPWLLLSQDNTYTGPAGVIAPVFSNADGSAWQLVNLPGNNSLDPLKAGGWFEYFTPKGPYIAFQTYFSEYTPKCDQNDAPVAELTDSIYLIKLPENKVIRQFRLFGQQSSEQIKKDDCAIVAQGLYDTPPVFGVIANNGNASWSPNGRYLAFAAAPDDPGADLYLYDTQTDRLRRLTNRQNNPYIVDWSPDGQSIIYRSVTRMNLFHVQILESSGLYAVSISGTDRLLFEPDAVPIDLQWLSQSQFVISDGYCNYDEDVCTTHLRLVDLSTGKNEVLYTDPNEFIGYETDPVHHLLLFFSPPISVREQGLLPAATEIPKGEEWFSGIYKFDLQTHTLQLMLAGDYGGYWNNKLQAFYSADWEEGPPRVYHTTLIRYKDDYGLTVEKVDNPPEISPDKEWKIVDDGYSYFIQDSQGNNIQELSSNAGCGWSPDSNSYMHLIEQQGGTWYEIYQKENNWKPTPPRKVPDGYMWWCRWISQ